MNDKTPGQIAFEAHQQWMGWPRSWPDLPPSEQAWWQHVGQAVANAVAPPPEET